MGQWESGLCNPSSCVWEPQNTLHWVLNPSFTGNAELNHFRIFCSRRHTNIAWGLWLAPLYFEILHSLYTLLLFWELQTTQESVFLQQRWQDRMSHLVAVALGHCFISSLLQRQDNPGSGNHSHQASVGSKSRAHHTTSVRPVPLSGHCTICSRGDHERAPSNILSRGCCVWYPGSTCIPPHSMGQTARIYSKSVRFPRGVLSPGWGRTGLSVRCWGVMVPGHVLHGFDLKVFTSDHGLKDCSLVHGLFRGGGTFRRKGLVGGVRSCESMCWDPAHFMSVPLLSECHNMSRWPWPYTPAIMLYCTTVHRRKHLNL